MNLNPPKTPSRHHIAEIEGLRGIALSLVVIFHLFGGGRVSGGIDVFLVISGFLLTRSITRKIDDGTPFLGAHFSRVLSRLVPSAIVVILFVAVATILISPVSQWIHTGRELIATALYYENWQLISSQLVYGAASVNTSPLQHFWSLSVQGQFFLAWPFLLIALAMVARSLGKRHHRTLLVAAVVITAASFSYSLFLVSADQSVAYLSTWTRVWELGIGAVVALGAFRLTLPEWVRNSLVWGGLVMIISCGFLIDGATEFPGMLALWPVVGTVLIILGAGSKSNFSPIHLLETRPLKFLARISYPLYLWHWPLIIFYLEFRGYDAVGWRGAAVILAVSVLLAWLTQRFIAEPFLLKQPSKAPIRSILVPVSVVATVSLVLAAGVGSVERSAADQLAEASIISPNHPGARALTEGAVPGNSSVSFIPSAEVAEQDLPDLYGRGCVQSYRSEPGMDEVLVCADEAATNPRKRIVMSGGSHVLHWYPALKAVAEQEGWQIDVVDKDGCRLTLRADDGNELSEMCHAWNDNALPKIIEMKPDVVFTVGTKTPEDDGSEVYFDGQVAAWAMLDDADIPVIAMRDTPRFPFRVPECLESHDDDPTLCGRARSEIFLDRAPVLDAVRLPTSSTVIDLSDSFCSPVSCEVVVGNVLTYRDGDHMTATYSKTLAPALRAQLKQQASWLF